MLKQILESSLGYTQINFRLYGGLLGIKLLETISTTTENNVKYIIGYSNNILEDSIAHEMNHIIGDVEYSIINKV